MCILYYLLNFEIKRILGSCPKLLHCVILSWFSSCFGWNLQFRTILKVVNKVHILWNQYLNFAIFMFWDGTLKNFIKMCIFLSIFGFVLIWRFRNLQFRTRLMVTLVSFWTPSRCSRNLKLQEKIKDTCRCPIFSTKQLYLSKMGSTRNLLFQNPLQRPHQCWPLEYNPRVRYGLY